MSIIRQVFGTTRPKDIFRTFLTFETLATKPIVHIIYWLGLGIFAIIAFAVLGGAVGAAIKEALPWGIFLAIPVLLVGWFSVLIGILIWRAFCEFFMAVLTIAEDLRYIRTTQERYDAEHVQNQSQNASQSMPFAQNQVSPKAGSNDELPQNEDPFFAQRTKED